MMKPTLWKIIRIIGMLFLTLWVMGSAFLHRPSAEEAITSPAEGFFAPDFTLPDSNGQHYSLADFRGRPVVLTLWASWCSPCKAEMPTFNQVYEEFGAEQGMILGVNVTIQDNLQDVNQFVADNALSFPILLDQNGDVAALYHLRGLPMTFFITPQGKIDQVFVGGPLSAATVRSFFATYSGEE